MDRAWFRRFRVGGGERGDGEREEGKEGGEVDELHL